MATRRAAAEVDAYVAGLEDGRREAVERVRAVIRRRLPRGYEEGMVGGMISYHVPHERYPAGYHCDPSKPVPFVQVASQKRHIGVYMFCLYMDPELQAWFREAWAGATDRRLDMGASCVRFSSLEGVPLDVIGDAVAKVPVKRFLEVYERGVGPAGSRGASPRGRKGSVKEAPMKTAKKAAKKKAAAKVGGVKKASPGRSGVKKATGSAASKGSVKSKARSSKTKRAAAPGSKKRVVRASSKKASSKKAASKKSVSKKRTVKKRSAGVVSKASAKKSSKGVAKKAGSKAGGVKKSPGLRKKSGAGKGGRRGVVRGLRR